MTWLWLLVGILALVCAVGGMQVAQARDARARDATQHARYAEALAAASDEAKAFVNVDHETAEDDMARIAAGRTGPLEDRYTEDVGPTSSACAATASSPRARCCGRGWCSVDESGATVIVATTGTRSDRRTKEPVARKLRLRLELVPVDGEWLTVRDREVD